ncbi:metal-dependent hydrolase [Natrialba asiatica]|uniref:Membrane-bound metal-dependent hydrolase n=1 Tax=Natrialba asiatica (strain ATCC 700177 / DSM 12278 / JCM 9576 / FERM P-10747 / NBRC 102637 / 172P1) TaxID=29540 RepID=M0AQ33_NATA1|nr:metal-dependent hydrolase [Natrialba asiatica]ELZ00841.1 membrane-bound metal-dependent hydrolase [Natrialba asiatica DSM 12278]
MWPWEHAIVGYLAYSLCSHLVYRRSPSGLEAFAVVFASVLPDIIDKPLAWEFGIFESGYALAHSVFIAIPLALIVGAIAQSTGRPRVGLAFGLGYLLHLPSDVLDTYFRGGQIRFDILLWPVETVESTGTSSGFINEFRRLFGQYLVRLLAGELPAYRWAQLGLVGIAALVWLYDGAPVVRECLRGCVRIVTSGR